MTDTRSRIDRIDNVNNFVDGYRSAIEHGAAALGASDAAKVLGRTNVGVTVALEGGEVAAVQRLGGRYIFATLAGLFGVALVLAFIPQQTNVTGER